MNNSTNRRTQKILLHFTLLSDATFGRGDGVPGLVDREVEQDENGLPVLRGRTLKGLLNEECANILYSLEQWLPMEQQQRWFIAAQRLFGAPGSNTVQIASMRYGDARLPTAIRTAVDYEIKRKNSVVARNDFLSAMTAIRRQTSLDEHGVPVDGSLRSMRVVLRETPFEAELLYQPPKYDPNQDNAAGDAPEYDDLALLAATIKAWCRGGSGRNRGRGRLSATLHDAQDVDMTQAHFENFQRALMQKEGRQ